MTWAALKLLLKGIPSWVWILLFLVASHATLYGMGRADQKEKDAAKFNAYKTEVQKAVAIRLTQNKIKEAEDRKVFAEIAEQYKKDIADAKAKGNRIAADLRAGNIRLRKQWQGCRSASEGAGATKGTDEDAELRAEGSGSLVRIGAEADAQVKGLQEGWKQCEKRYPANTEPEGLQDK